MPRHVVTTLLFLAAWLFFSLLLIGTETQTAYAEQAERTQIQGQQPTETPPVLDPGRDPQLEEQRRESGFGRFGLSIPLSLAIIATGLLLAYKREVANWLIAVLLVLASLSFTLAVVEIGFRATSDKWAQHVKVRSNCYYSNPRGVFVHSEMAGHPESAAWCVDPLDITWQQCEQGYTPASPNDREILAIGDSFTDGVGVFRKQAWPQRLQADLQKDGETTITVSNCGHADYDTLQVHARLQQVIDRHKPSILIYAMTLNDIPAVPANADGAADVSFQIENRTAYLTRVAEHPIFGPLSRQFALGRFFIERYVTAQIARQTERMYATALDDPQRPEVRKAFAAIQAMQTEAKQRNAHFLVVLWPMIYKLSDYPFQQTQNRIMETLEKDNIEALDLLPALHGYTDEQLQVHPTDFHPNEIAHELAAKAILAKLRQLNWL